MLWILCYTVWFLNVTIQFLKDRQLLQKLTISGFSDSYVLFGSVEPDISQRIKVDSGDDKALLVKIARWYIKPTLYLRESDGWREERL